MTWVNKDSLILWQGRHVLFKHLLLGAKWFVVLRNKRISSWLFGWESWIASGYNLLNTNHIRQTLHNQLWRSHILSDLVTNWGWATLIPFFCVEFVQDLLFDWDFFWRLIAHLKSLLEAIVYLIHQVSIPDRQWDFEIANQLGRFFNTTIEYWCYAFKIQRLEVN